MRSYQIQIVLLLALGLLSQSAHALEDAAIFRHKAAIWKIAGTSQLKRWIVIHNLEQAASTGVFQIEVIGRQNGKPAWQIEHLCNHMAITLAALKKSALAPLKSGAVYPEAFDSAYLRWQNAPQAQKRLCESSVLECMSQCQAL